MPLNFVEVPDIWLSTIGEGLFQRLNKSCESSDVKSWILLRSACYCVEEERVPDKGRGKLLQSVFQNLNMFRERVNVRAACTSAMLRY